jgi:hypothetical protein
MTTFKILIAAALLSMTAVTSASAQQLPTWAATNPDSFEAQYPNRDVLNGGALTPAGKMGLELPGGAAPAFGANNAATAYRHEPRHLTMRYGQGATPRFYVPSSHYNDTPSYNDPSKFGGQSLGMDP